MSNRSHRSHPGAHSLLVREALLIPAFAREGETLTAFNFTRTLTNHKAPLHQSYSCGFASGLGLVTSCCGLLRCSNRWMRQVSTASPQKESDDRSCGSPSLGDRSISGSFDTVSLFLICSTATTIRLPNKRREGPFLSSQPCSV